MHAVFNEITLGAFKGGVARGKAGKLGGCKAFFIGCWLGLLTQLCPIPKRLTSQAVMQWLGVEATILGRDPSSYYPIQPRCIEI